MKKKKKKSGSDGMGDGFGSSLKTPLMKISQLLLFQREEKEKKKWKRVREESELKKVDGDLTTKK